MQPLRKLGPYELVERLAVGGMAEIYVARARGAQGFEKEYVLKLIHPKYVGDQEFIRMLVDEAKLVGALTHPNVAQVIDLGVDGDAYYILMEYVRGKDLYQVLNRAWDLGFNLPIPMCLQVARDMCAGLYYAHNKCDDTGRPLNIVHRDISPQNVLISFNGEGKIVDFGVAKAALGARPETRAGIIKGKFRYMSPEQAWGKKLDGRSDLFSVGLCLYEMLCGETAYEDEGDMQKMLATMRAAKFIPPSRHRPEVDPELEQIVMRALALEREDRYPTCHALEVALARYTHRHFPGYTRLDITAVMKEMYPDETRLVHTPEPTEKTTGTDGVEVGTDELEAMGFIEIPEDRVDTGDMTLRQSIVRGPAATGTPIAAPNPAPLRAEADDTFAGEETDFFLQDHEIETADGLSDTRSLLPSRRVTAPPRAFEEEEATVDLPSFRARDPKAFMTHIEPSPAPNRFMPRETDMRHQRRAANPRRDTVADLIERHLPPSAAHRALQYHRRLAELLETPEGSNLLVAIMGITLGLFVLFLLALFVF